MLKGSIRRIPTKSLVDRLLNIVQLPSQDDILINLTRLIKTQTQQKEVEDCNLINDVIHHWAIEEPKKVALCTEKTNQDECQQFTFDDLRTQSSRFANVLTGKDFELAPGNTVLVILPNSAPERILLQLACSQIGLTFSPYNPTDFSGIGVTERIGKLAVDCIITDEDHLEIAREYTHNALRPLKKGLITNCSTSQPIPVGWNHLIQRVTDAKSEYAQTKPSHPPAPVLRFLSNNNQVIEYSQKHLNLHLLLVGLWLNLEKTSRLIWMKNSNEIISMAPWLFGTSIFLKPAQDLQTLIDTFEQHPIDTFCSSPANYQLLTNEQAKKPTHLTQLLSTESIDPQCKSQWHSLTDLCIRDNYGEFNDPSVFQTSSSDAKPQPLRNDIKLNFNKTAETKTIPLKKLLSQYCNNPDQIREKLSRV